MLDKIKTFLTRASITSESFGEPTVSTPAGYFSPAKAEELAATAQRKDSLQKIRENSSLSAEAYRQLYQAPVYNLLECVQNVPATSEGQWAQAGSFSDLTLRFTAYVVRLARGYMFPPGAAPEDQAAQSVMWQAVIFWSALFYHMPLLASLEGETTSGVSWQPGISVPLAPYRFRFRSHCPTDNEASAMAALAASQLMPAEAISWLSGNHTALVNLASAFWNSTPEMPLIRTLLRQAAEMVDSPMITKEADKLPVTTGIPAHPEDTDMPQPSQAENNSVSTAVGLAASELMASLCNENVEPPIKVSAPGEQPQEDQTISGMEDADMLLSLFSTERDVEPLGKTAFHDEAHSAADEIMVSEGEACAQQGKEDQPGRQKIAENAEPVISTPPVFFNQSSTVAAQLTPGKQFLSWLSDGLASGRITINKGDSRVHSVAGFLYLLVPEIFYLFLKETGSEYSREQIQPSFEKLRIHRIRKGERFIKAKLYFSENKQGRFNKVNGYLIKSSHLKVGQPPEDSNLLSFP